MIATKIMWRDVGLHVFTSLARCIFTEPGCIVSYSSYASLSSALGILRSACILQRLVGCPSADDWHRFLARSLSVRRFADRAYDFQSRLSHASLTRALGPAGNTELFPALRTLLVDVWHLRPPLLSRSIVVLALLVSRPLFGDDYCVVCACLNRAPPYLPNVTTLRLDGDAHLEYFHRPIARFCLNLPALQQLIIAPSALSMALLEELSRCKFLATVRITEVGRSKVDGILYEAGAQIRSPMAKLLHDAFPSLREFSFTAASTRSAQELVTHPFYPSYRLTSLWIRFPRGAFFRPEEIKNLLFCLCDVCTALERLTLRFAPYASPLYFDQATSVALTYADICPFLTFPRLLHFAIDHSRPLVLSEVDVEAIASQAGRFEVLWLNPFPPIHAMDDLPILPGVESLFHFALNCPRLTRLGILIDARGRVAASEDIPRFVRLQELFVGWSPISVLEDVDAELEWKDLALFLHYIVSPSTVLSSVREQGEEEIRDLVSSDMRAMCQLTGRLDMDFAPVCHAWRLVWGMTLFLRSRAT